MFLAISEIRRNKSRFLLIGSIIALVTALILFVVALAEGLGSGNIEGIKKIDADLLVFQKKSKLSLSASALPLARVRQVERVDGVANAGAIGFSSAAIPGASAPLGIDVDVALLGVQAGEPGEPALTAGRQFRSDRERSAIIDRRTQLRTGLGEGDTITLRSVQDASEELYALTIVGVTDDRQFSLRPSVFVPLRVWDRIRPGTLANVDTRAPIANFIAVQLEPSADPALMKKELEAGVSEIEAADLPTAYQATPGYREQQSTLNLQQGFTWFIGLLVIGVFFQIITLQKVGQIGVLKAMGASNATVVGAAIFQTLLVTTGGVAVGALLAGLLALAIPPTVPLSWPADRLALTLATLLVMGPLGGILSIRILLNVEPLTALGLSK